MLDKLIIIVLCLSFLSATSLQASLQDELVGASPLTTSFRASAIDKPEILVILLHGGNKTGDIFAEEFFRLLPDLQNGLPNAEFIAPDAPYKITDLVPDNTNEQRKYRFWGDIEVITKYHINPEEAAIEDRFPKGYRQAMPLLNTYIDQELNARGFTEENLALVSFSQGGVIGFQVALTRPKSCAAFLALSTLYLKDTMSRPKLNKTPILMVKGDKDQYIDADLFNYSIEQLNQQDIHPERVIIAGLKHELSTEAMLNEPRVHGLKAGLDFLKRVLNKK